MRPRDWAPLAAADPVPGDADELAALAQRYRDTATAIRDARDALDRLHGDEGWDSDAGVEFRRSSRETAGQVGQALVRYERAAEGLTTYVRELRDVQAAADALRLRARAVQDEVDAARAAERVALAAPPESPEAVALGHRRAAVAAAEARLAALRTSLSNDVVPRWEAAGVAAAAALQAISAVDGLADGRWEDFVGAMKTVATWAGKASAFFGVLALICSVVPFLQPFAALFAVLALLTGVVSLAGHGLAYAQGRGSLSEVLWATAGVLTFGLGRAFTTTARVLGKAAASTARPSYVTALRAAGSTRAQARSTARTVDWAGTRGIPHGAALGQRVAGRLPWVPRPGEVASALSPRRVVTEVVDDLRTFRTGMPLPSQAEAAALEAARGLPSAVRATPEVGAALRVARLAEGVTTTSTTVSAYADARELGFPLPPFDAPPVPGSGSR